MSWHFSPALILIPGMIPDVKCLLGSLLTSSYHFLQTSTQDAASFRPVRLVIFSSPVLDRQWSVGFKWIYWVVSGQDGQWPAEFPIPEANTRFVSRESNKWNWKTMPKCKGQSLFMNIRGRRVREFPWSV